MQGLPFYVFRSSLGDTTGGGASASVPKFTVVGTVREVKWRELRAKGENVIEPLHPRSQVFDPSGDAPAAVLVRPNLDGGPPNLVPLDVFQAGEWSMFGGNLAACSDSRGVDVVSSFFPGFRLGMVQIHDRVER